MNSKGKGRAEWSRRSGARSCRELPAPLYLAWRKEWPAAASEPFSLSFNRSLVKGAQTGKLNTERERERERECVEWNYGSKGRRRKERGSRRVTGSLHKPIVIPPLCTELLALFCDREAQSIMMESSML